MGGYKVSSLVNQKARACGPFDFHNTRNYNLKAFVMLST
jgi:hypothetical protein